MALIKCPECENMISENAKACPKCGVTIKSKKEKEIVLAESELDNFFINLVMIFFIGLGGIIFIVLLMRYNAMEENSGSLANYTFILGLIPIIIGIVYNRRAKKVQLVLTNKRLYGITYPLFGKIKIDIPLDNISSLTSIEQFGVSGVLIEASGSLKYKIWNISNVEFIKQKFIEQVD